MNDRDQRLGEWIAELRKAPEPRAAAIARLRAALRQERRQGRSSTGAWVRRRIVLTPAGAVAAAVAVMVVTSLFWLSAGRIGSDQPGDGMTPVQFVLHADDVSTVVLVGDFNDWDPDATPMERTGRGVWSVVVPLAPGAVRYSFLLDGHEWRADPGAATVASDFGRPTSLAMITEPEAGR